MRPSTYTIYVPLPEEDRYMLVHGYTGAVDLVNSRVINYMKALGPLRLRQFGNNGDGTEQPLPANSLPISDATIARLRERGYLTDKTPEEEEEHLARLARALYVKDQYMGAGILFIPSYGCNLRCPYCFEKDLYRHGEDYQHGVRPGWEGRAMTRETADLAFKALAQIEPNPKRIMYVEFYGGEPLIHYTRDIVEYILAKGLALGYRRWRATTNGVELDRFFDLIGPGKIEHLQITIDGPPEVHDKRRFLPGKAPTFEIIARNINKALELGASVAARVNVDKRNAEHIERLAETFKRLGWTGHSRFSSYLANVTLNKEKRSASQRFATEAEMDEYSRQGKGGGTIRGTDWGIEGKIAGVFRTGQFMPLRAHFCGAAVGMYLLDLYGDIYSCWELVGEKHAKIGEFVPELKWGNGLTRWRSRSVANIPECRQCRYALFCGGGCPKWAYDATGNFNSPYCNGFEQSFLHYAPLAYRKVKAEREGIAQQMASGPETMPAASLRLADSEPALPAAGSAKP